MGPVFPAPFHLRPATDSIRRGFSAVQRALHIANIFGASSRIKSQWTIHDRAALALQLGARPFARCATEITNFSFPANSFP
jgi:hypothetical protein